MTEPATFYRDPLSNVRYRSEVCGLCKFNTGMACMAGMKTYTGCELRELKTEKKGGSK